MKISSSLRNGARRSRNVLVASAHSSFVILFATSLIGCSTRIPVGDRCPAGDLRCQLPFTERPSSLKPVGRLVMDLQDLRPRNINGDSGQILDHLASESSRLKLLHLQALAKVYARRDLDEKDLKRLEEFRDEVRTAEGFIGDFNRRSELYETAKKGDAPAEVLAEIRRRADANRAEILAKLTLLGWIPDLDAKLSHLSDDLSKLDLGKAKKNQKNVVVGLRDLVVEERDELKDLDSYFKPKHFTQGDLERGLHTMRRDLRWVTNGMVASEGMFSIPGSLAGADQLLEAKYGSSKYIQFPTIQGIEPVPLDRRAVMQVAMLVTELGLMKDFKEAQLDYAEILIEAGFAASHKAAESAAAEVMTRSFARDVNIEDDARAIYKFYLKTDPLKQIKKDLERALDRDEL